MTFTEPDALQAYVQRNGLPFPVVVDPDRRSYRAYGFGRGSTARIWGVRSWLRYGTILRRDGLSALRKPVDDTRQLGGNMVIAPDGTLAWGYWGTGPADRPTVDELVAAVDRSRSAG